MEPSRPLWIIKLFSVMDAEYMEIAILKIHYVQKTISFIKLYAFVMLDIQVRLLTTYYFFKIEVITNYAFQSMIEKCNFKFKLQSK